MADGNITAEVSTKDAQKHLLCMHRENARLRRRIMADAVASDATAENVVKLAQSLAEAKAEAERLRAALEAVLAWGTDETYERAKAACDTARALLGPNAQVVRREAAGAASERTQG